MFKKKNLVRNSIFYKLYLIIFSIKYKILPLKKTYSQFGEDLIIKKFFKKKIGKYVDVGCYHPIKYNNTALLYYRGWNGINIDLNQTSIDLFNCLRKKDLNIVACLSDKNKKVTLYFDNLFSSLNSIYKYNVKNFKIKNFKKIQTRTKTFSSVVTNNFDFLNLDCEGNDYNVLKSINFNHYTPKLICVEILSSNKKKIYHLLESYNYKVFKINKASHFFKKNNLK